MKQTFTCMPGKIAVVREKVSETYDKAGLLARPETEREFASRVNPWALVVGVGGPKKTDHGTVIVTSVVPGDKVLVAQVGMSVFLDDGEGGDWIYVVPFEGVLGKLVENCETCDALAVEGKCPTCPAPVKIDVPTPDEVSIIQATR